MDTGLLFRCVLLRRDVFSCGTFALEAITTVTRAHQLWGRAPQDPCEAICSASWRWIRSSPGQCCMAAMEASKLLTLFSGPVGDTGWRKQFERYENSASNNALRETHFTISLCLHFIFSHFYTFLFPSSLPPTPSFFFSFFLLVWNKKFRSKAELKKLQPRDKEVFSTFCWNTLRLFPR